ncbi:MAG: hypothetical protein IJV74_03825 [Clostridia bacterium]|nr:hypothetical protein [Clostridia bacterium]
MSNAAVIDAGELRERVSVLTLKDKGSEYVWEESRRSWAKAELNTRKNIWSVHGIGATGVTFVMRCSSLCLDNALKWRGQHCFISSIIPYGRGHVKVEAALVEPVQCEDKYKSLTFPALMTEEWHKHEQLEPHAINTLSHVLVTPKCIELKPGKLVTVAGDAWPIKTAHTLDPHKNEYIIERTVDL